MFLQMIAYVCMHVRVCFYACMHVRIAHVHACAFVCVCICMFAQIKLRGYMQIKM